MHSEAQHKGTQLLRVRTALETGAWLTLIELGQLTGDPVASISAQIRHLRKRAHGALTIKKRRRGQVERGLYEYRLVESAKGEI
jgi:hypothetical protein